MKAVQKNAMLVIFARRPRYAAVCVSEIEFPGWGAI